MTWAFSGGPIWAYMGLYFLFSAGWGFCVFYGIFKSGTLKNEDLKQPLFNEGKNEKL